MSQTTFSRPMKARDIDEAHRPATPLELLFDLVSVIAIAAAAAGLHHAIAQGHALEGVLKFSAAFFAIWWAWMNYTWFASAYDNDDVPFRLLTMVIMSGSLVIAAGIGNFFESTDLTLVVIGYVIMRVGMVLLWLRAAVHDTEHRRSTLRYALGIALVQVYWVGLLLLQPPAVAIFYLAFALGVLLELAVPVIAERSGTTPWHRHHIMERYGLLNIIVLGETLLAASLSLENAAGEHFDPALVLIALSAMVILFSLWWLYFCREEHLQTHDLSRALTWGYGHVVVYAAGAAVGAGIAVLVDIVTEHATVSVVVGHYAVAIPVALYFVSLWFIRDRFVLQGRVQYVLPLMAILVLVAPSVMALPGIALVSALTVVVRSRVSR